MTKRERLQILAQNIKMVEIRILDLQKDLKTESDVKKKMLMQHSLKTNKEMLKTLQEQYWADDVDNIKTRFPGL